jgi:hypothetical protein
MIDQPPATRFDCRNCGAHYRLVRVEAEAETTTGKSPADRAVHRYKHAKGRYILKYFLVDRLRIQARAGSRR